MNQLGRSIRSPSVALVPAIPITEQGYNRTARQLATNNILRKSVQAYLTRIPDLGHRRRPAHLRLAPDQGLREIDDAYLWPLADDTVLYSAALDVGFVVDADIRTDYAVFNLGAPRMFIVGVS